MVKKIYIFWTGGEFTHSIECAKFTFLSVQASCTLEAGVKIYSARVDSVHSEAYKVLGGMNRAGQDNEQG